MWLPNLWRLPDALMKRAQRRGSPDKAHLIAERYARLRTKDPHAWQLWSDALVQDAWDQFGDDFDDDVSRMPKGALGPAEDVLRNGLQALPENKSLQVSLARLCLSRFTLEEDADLAGAEEAERILSEIHDSDPSFVEALIGLAEVALYRRDWHEFDRLTAEAEGRISTTAEPDLQQSLIGVLVFAPTGRDRAKELLRGRISLRPEEATSRILLALLMEEEEPVDARSELETARPLFPPGDFDRFVERTRRTLRRWGPEWWQDSGSA